MSTQFLDSAGNVRLAGVPNSQTRTITTDPDDFYDVAVFDLGHVAVVYVVATVLALDPDGETFGEDSGDILAVLGFADIGFAVVGGISPDGTTYYGNNTFILLANANLVTVGAVKSVLITSARYLRPIVGIHDVDSGDPYAGSNNPTAQVRIDVSYL